MAVEMRRVWSDVLVAAVARFIFGVKEYKNKISVTYFFYVFFMTRRRRKKQIVSRKCRLNNFKLTDYFVRWSHATPKVG